MCHLPVLGQQLAARVVDQAGVVEAARAALGDGPPHEGDLRRRRRLRQRRCAAGELQGHQCSDLDAGASTCLPPENTDLRRASPVVGFPQGVQHAQTYLQQTNVFGG